MPDIHSQLLVQSFLRVLSRRNRERQNTHMTATLKHQVAELRRANAELQQRLDDALAERDRLSHAAAQQMAACDEQIGECTGHHQAMRVLFEPAIAHLGKAEHPLDNPDRMFDPRFREGRLLARTLDLVRFFARSTTSTTPRWR